MSTEPFDPADLPDPNGVEIDDLTSLRVTMLYKLFERGVPTPKNEVKPGMPVSILIDHSRYSFGYPQAADGALIIAELRQGTYLGTTRIENAFWQSPNKTIELGVIDFGGRKVHVIINDDGTGVLIAGGPTYDLKLNVLHEEKQVTFTP